MNSAIISLGISSPLRRRRLDAIPGAGPFGVARDFCWAWPAWWNVPILRGCLPLAGAPFDTGVVELLVDGATSARSSSAAGDSIPEEGRKAVWVADPLWFVETEGLLPAAWGALSASGIRSVCRLLTDSCF